MDKPKLWTKDFINITTISFFIFLAFYILLTALPIQITKEFGGGADQAGLLLTLFLIAAIIIRPFAGKWVSVGSQKKILIYSALAFFIPTLFYPFVTNIWTLFILRIIHGITFGVITTVKGTISAEIIPDSRRGEGMSWFSLAMGLAMVIGPVIGLNLANIGAYKTAYIICIVISVLNILLSMVIHVPEQGKQEKVSKTSKRFDLNDLIDKKAAPFALVVFILACAYSGIASFLALYAQEINLVKAASTFFILYAGLMFVFRPFTGVWADRYGANKIVYPCIILFAVGMVMLSLPQTAVIMILAGAIIGIGYGSVTPILQTQVISSVEKHRVGIANSLFFNSMDLGMAIGALVLGIAANSFGYGSVFISGIALIIVGGIAYFALASGKEKEPRHAVGLKSVNDIKYK
ncbi:MFS transporter [Neobacillus drentensis]|uniref:MFS transporter n=1 Tax=Neobacillus drentensis TaxID=220684 RepID=UPI00285EE2A8|nr:MFS transporter [Neobacillus drentensis]MDR7240102.1 putative MFS family arabinose efflux permease [Neobacillus drentensis]